MDDNIVYLKDFKEKQNTQILERTIEEYFLSLETEKVIMKPKSALQIKLETLGELQDRLQEELEELKNLQEELLQAQGSLNKRATWKMIKRVTTTLKVIRSNIEVKKKEITNGSR